MLRFYGYDLDGATNMLTESKMNENEANMTNVTEATNSSTTTPVSALENETTVEDGGDDDGDESTTFQPDTTDNETLVTDENIASTEPTDVEENEEITTVASGSRKRRGRLGRGLKPKNLRDRKQLSLIKSPPQVNVSRRSRSYYVLLDEDYENEFHLDSTSPVSSAPMGPSTSSPTLISTVHPTKYRRNNNNPKDVFDNANSDTVEHIFYLNEHETIRVPFKIYDTIMKFCHIESLQASVIEIDLDTDFYNLIIIIPDYLDGLGILANKLRSHDASTLRRIRNQMDFYWVKTIVPKFSLKGNTILTNDLQNVSAEKRPCTQFPKQNQFN